MSDIAIRVEGLSKLYRIGQRERYKALRDTLTDTMYAPFRAVASMLNGRWSAVGAQPDNYIWALKDVSFEVKRGEVIGIIGRNGAGKSTLLKILSRITEPTEGHAEIHGRVGSLLEVGTGFHPELTGRENIYLNGAILGMKRTEIDRKFDEIVAFAEVERFVDTPVKHFSSGMYVRLAFSVAAHLELEILLLDEVLAVGDAAFQKKCMGRMSEDSGKGRTVLFVSHNMEAVLKLCSRVIWLLNGRIAADGPPDQVVDAYLGEVRRLQVGGTSGVSLERHPGRLKRMDGLVRLTHYRVARGHDSGSGPVPAGTECRIILGYETDFPLTGARVDFVVMFRAENSQRVASCWSQLASVGLEKLEPVGEVECYIPRLPLAPGRYLLDVGCQVASGWADMVYEAAMLYVVEGPFYLSGRLPTSGSGPFLMEYTWTKRQPEASSL